MIARKYLHTFPTLSVAAIACVALAGASSLAQTPSAGGALAGGAEASEIPVPPIATKVGTLPGVDALPMRTAMPDVMVMDDGTPVTSRRQWEARRKEMRRTLSRRRPLNRRDQGSSRAPRATENLRWSRRHSTIA